jgi:GH25 family lysozyme M1 (1,4-beta-N-acetylmuramidase)
MGIILRGEQMKSLLINFILNHKPIVIIIISAAVTATVATTSAFILINNNSTTDASPSTKKITTTEEITTESVTETTAETTTQLIPIEKLKVSKKDTSSSKEVMGANQIAEDAPKNTGAIYEISDLVYGIDVSKWQGKIDWAQVKASGIKFAIIKIAGRYGESGGLYQDPYFTANIEGALANGIQVGVYFFSQAVTEQEALEEASLTISYLRNYRLTYPVCFDWETRSSLPRTYNAGLSKDRLTSIASTFCDVVKSAGYTPMVYKNDWLNRYNAGTLSSKYKSWLANYFNSYQNSGNWYQLGENLPSYPYSYQMWQYSSRGRVNGISGNVDLDLGFFSYSGSSVPSAPIKLNLTKTSFVTYAGTAVNLLEGVTAANTIGANVTSSVTITIKNSNVATVDENTAFNTPGTYVLTYKIVDFTGGSKTANATLIVNMRETEPQTETETESETESQPETQTEQTP